MPLPAPDFTLPDQSGSDYVLSSRRGVGSTVLVFIRGHWCPYCRRYLCKLQTNLDRMTELGAGLVAVSPETVAQTSDLAKELQITFPMVSDTEGVAIAAYGVRNAHASSLMPHPAAFVIASDGMLRFRSIDRNFKKRTTVRALRGVLAELDDASATSV